MDLAIQCPSSRPGSCVVEQKWENSAFFHHPDELEAELVQAGLILENTLGIQGPAWIVSKFEAYWQDPERRDLILRIARLMEGEPAVSPHMVAIARRGE